jgi:hypothetical protein
MVGRVAEDGDGMGGGREQGTVGADESGADRASADVDTDVAGHGFLLRPTPLTDISCSRLPYTLLSDHDGRKRHESGDQTGKEACCVLGNTKM